ncbi:hypothetical protein AVEN_192490-1 [Araneus ventricosus]|uniref:Uncharacterized protein n=1 Tax=Araneus ventricosus TaxID=182803 RepID=A0A4Y2RAR6_ARAVE|nr:hypothetical protein AVEN_192490-1 [Araneus ventricosus]
MIVDDSVPIPYMTPSAINNGVFLHFELRDERFQVWTKTTLSRVLLASRQWHTFLPIWSKDNVNKPECTSPLKWIPPTTASFTDRVTRQLGEQVLLSRDSSILLPIWSKCANVTNLNVRLPTEWISNDNLLL